MRQPRVEHRTQKWCPLFTGVALRVADAALWVTSEVLAHRKIGMTGTGPAMTWGGRHHRACPRDGGRKTAERIRCKAIRSVVLERLGTFGIRQFHTAVLGFPVLEDGFRP